MSLKTQSLVNEIEEIKARLISIEMNLIRSEKASKKDKRAVKEALEEYKKGETSPFKV